MSLTRLISMLALAATLGAPLAARAQTTASPNPVASGAPSMGHHHHRHHRQSLMHALQSLQLTDDQKKQVRAIASQEQQANLNADSATKHANATKMHDQIMSVLTPDQRAQLKATMHHGPNMGAGAEQAPNNAPAPVATASPAPH